MACSDGGGLVEPSGMNTYARVSEQVLNELYQSSETNFASADSPLIFSTMNECETQNILRINNEEIRLVRSASAISEFGTDFFAIDKNMRYAILVSLSTVRNYAYSVNDFVQLAGNDILIYRLRPTGTESFRIISIHSLRNTTNEVIDVCVGSNGTVFSGNDLIFNRISTFVSLNFRTRIFNQTDPG